MCSTHFYQGSAKARKRAEGDKSSCKRGETDRGKEETSTRKIENMLPLGAYFQRRAAFLQQFWTLFFKFLKKKKSTFECSKICPMRVVKEFQDIFHNPEEEDSTSYAISCECDDTSDIMGSSACCTAMPSTHLP